MSLDRLTRQILTEKPSLLQKLRRSFAAKVLPFFAVGALTFTSACQSRYKPCVYDYDCVGEEVCIENVCISPVYPCTKDSDCLGEEICVNNYCTFNGQPACASDMDCPGDQLCVNHICTYQEHPKTEPQEIFNEFVIALEKGNPAEISKYFHPQSAQLYTSVLSGHADLSQEFKGFYFGEIPSSLAKKLKGVNLTLENEFGNIRDYSYPCTDKSGGSWECLLRFKKDENGSWKIKNF